MAAPRKESTSHAAAGGRLGVEIPLSSVLFAQVGAEVLATLTRTTLYVDDEPMWTTPALFAALFGGIGATFW